MRKATIDADTSEQAQALCKLYYGWTPDAIREVDSGDDGKAWMCFESSGDAETWDKQL